MLTLLVNHTCTQSVITTCTQHSHMCIPFSSTNVIWDPINIPCQRCSGNPNTYTTSPTFHWHILSESYHMIRMVHNTFNFYFSSNWTNTPIQWYPRSKLYDVFTQKPWTTCLQFCLSPLIQSGWLNNLCIKRCGNWSTLHDPCHRCSGTPQYLHNWSIWRTLKNRVQVDDPPWFTAYTCTWWWM